MYDESNPEFTQYPYRRIVQMSGLLQESGFVNTTDRLVFTTPDGESCYIEIDTWQPANN